MNVFIILNIWFKGRVSTRNTLSWFSHLTHGGRDPGINDIDMCRILKRRHIRMHFLCLITNEQNLRCYVKHQLRNLG